MKGQRELMTRLVLNSRENAYPSELSGRQNNVWELQELWLIMTRPLM